MPSGGNHGGGRPKGSLNKKTIETGRKVFVSSSVSGTPEEIQALKDLAKKNGKTFSRYVIETLLNQ